MVARSRIVYIIVAVVVLCAINLLLVNTKLISYSSSPAPGPVNTPTATNNNNNNCNCQLTSPPSPINPDTRENDNTTINIVVSVIFDTDLTQLHSMTNSWGQKRDLQLSNNQHVKVHYLLFMPEKMKNLHPHPEFFTATLAPDTFTLIEEPTLFLPHARFPPVISAVSARRMNADWFVFVRAETFVYLHNLAQIVAPLDQESALCLGHILRGDDTAQVMSVDAGFVLSNGAMQILTQSDACHTDPADLDTTLATELFLAQCLTDAEIQFVHVPGFRPLDPLETIMANVRKNGGSEYHPRAPALASRLLNVEPRDRRAIVPVTYFNVSQQVAQVIYDEGRANPKIIHQIWMGDITKAPLEYMFGCKELALRHGWTYKLWDDNTINTELLPMMVNGKIYTEFPNMHGKSDILRYELLYHWGGVYVDADTVCFRPFDLLLAKTRKDKKEAFLAYENEEKRGTLLGSSILGAVQYSSAMLTCIWELNFRKLTDPAFISVGPYLLTDAFEKYGMSAKIFPSKTFFPFHMTEFSVLEKEKWRLDDPNVFTFHRFATTVGGYKAGGSIQLYLDYLSGKDPVKAAISYALIKNQLTTAPNSSSVCIDVNRNK
jgi:hypothetical protein